MSHKKTRKYRKPARVLTVDHVRVTKPVEAVGSASSAAMSVPLSDYARLDASHQSLRKRYDALFAIAYDMNGFGRAFRDKYFAIVSESESYKNRAAFWKRVAVASLVIGAVFLLTALEVLY